MRSRTYLTIAATAMAAALLLAVAGCTGAADAKAQAYLDAASVHFKNWAASTDQLGSAITSYTVEAKKGPRAVKQGLPALDNADTVLKARNQELMAVTAQLSKIQTASVSANTRDTVTKLAEMVVLAHQIDTKLGSIISAMRESGTYVSSGGKDAKKLSSILDKAGRDNEALTELFRRLGLKQAEVSKLLNK